MGDYVLLLTLRTPLGDVALPPVELPAPPPAALPATEVGADALLYPTLASAPAEVQSAIMQNFAPSSWEGAALIAGCESGYDPVAERNDAREHSIGLFQINVRAHPQWAGLDLRHPWTNAHIAALLHAWAGGKWTPWWNCAGKLGLPR